MANRLDDILSRSCFIGGSPCSGKSTVSEIIARTYDLDLLMIDQYEKKHVDQCIPHLHPAMHRFREMSWDEVWMRPIEIQTRDEFQFYEERFGMVLDELRSMPGKRPVIAEGAAFLPRLLHSMGIDGPRAVFMVPTRDFQVTHYAQREFIKGILSQCSHPEQAFENWMERDYRFGRQVAEQAIELGFTVIEVDGRRSVCQTVDMVSSCLGLAGRRENR